MTSTSKLCAPSRTRWSPSRAAPWSFRTIAGFSIASQHISSPSKVTPKWSGSKVTIRSMLRITGNAKAKMPPSPTEYATSHSQGETRHVHHTARRTARRISGHCPHLSSLPDADSSHAGGRPEIRGSRPPQAEARRHRVSLRRLRRAGIPEVPGQGLYPAKGGARRELHGNRARAREFPADVSSGGSGEPVQGSAQLLRGGVFQRLRGHEPAHRAVAVPRARRARQAGAVRHAAGNSHPG